MYYKIFEVPRGIGVSDQASIYNALPEQRMVLRRFKPEDIFNADEYGDFYSMAPDRTIATERLPGRKRVKTKLN